VQLTFRPISTWPGVLTEDRLRSPFSASYKETIRLLERELDHLAAENAVLELDVGESDLRLDGRVRASARPGHPGVIVSFGSTFGPLRYATDLYLDWHANLRAIALGLEALRRIDRYGITKTGEQYAGWRALGTGSEEPMSEAEAAAYLSKSSVALVTVPEILRSPESRDLAFRSASKILHPDVPTTGNELGFKRLVKAKQTLDEASRVREERRKQA